MVEILSEHWRRVVLLCVLATAVFAVSLVIANKIRRDRRTAARLLRESDARDAARLRDRLSELAARAHVAEDEKDKGTKEERKKLS
jgi:hypothetical protein